MINVKDNLPNHGERVIVKNHLGYFAIARYYKDFGFDADDFGYDIYANDNSGLQVEVDGTVESWMPVPK